MNYLQQAWNAPGNLRNAVYDANDRVLDTKAWGLAEWSSHPHLRSFVQPGDWEMEQPMGRFLHVVKLQNDGDPAAVRAYLNSLGMSTSEARSIGHEGWDGNYYFSEDVRREADDFFSTFSLDNIIASDWSILPNVVGSTYLPGDVYRYGTEYLWGGRGKGRRAGGVGGGPRRRRRAQYGGGGSYGGGSSNPWIKALSAARRRNAETMNYKGNTYYKKESRGRNNVKLISYQR